MGSNDMTFSADDHGFMARALELAARGLYTTDPNPRVGSVIVRDGVVVGEGWHVSAGEPHAEIHALRAAGERASGATVYVTLEPCCHHGRTPPCTDALIAAGVARVIAAMPDPNPRVAGGGLRILAAQGITVGEGLLAAQAAALNPGFIKRMQTGRPYVRCKLAMSLDGRTAMASGQSRWITSEPARLDVQRLRARSSAVMTGVGTVLADDPSLTVRLDDVARQPLRVVIDTHLSMPSGSRMLGLPGRTVVLTSTRDEDLTEALRAAGADVMALNEDGAVDLVAVMDYLGQQAINEVLVETGATLSGALLQAGLVDELVIYMAPKLMGDGARGLFRLPGLERMDQAIGLEIQDLRAVGADWRITAKVSAKKQ